MAAKIAHHAITLLFRMHLNGMGHIAQMVAGFRLRNAQHHRFIGRLDQPTRLDIHLSDQIGAVGIAMPAIEQRGDIDIDDIAFFQGLWPGNAMADDMVYRGAAAVRIAPIIERCGNSATIKGHGPNQIVNGLRRHAGLNKGHKRVENLGGEAACLAHPVKGVGAMQADDAGAQGNGVVGDNLILSHCDDIGEMREGRKSVPSRM